MRLVFILFFLPLATFAQNFTTAKTAAPKAVDAYEKGRKSASLGDWAGAIRAYQKSTDIDSTFIDAWIFCGGAQLKSGHWQGAESSFEHAIQLNTNYEPLVLYLCAQAEWEQNKFSEAAAHAEAFRAIDRVDPALIYELRRFIENARFSAQAVAHPVPFNPQPLSEAINTANDEYLPAFTADGKTLIFTRKIFRPIGNTDQLIDDENFYFSQMDDAGNWRTALEMAGINTLHNEGAEAINADGSWFVFTACNRSGDGSQGSCDLYWSQLRGEEWTKPKPFSSAINSEAWDAQPSISPDGKTIFFSSTRDGGKGGSDIWFTSRLTGGRWTKPANLSVINTPGDEVTPFLHPDGKTLYFGSDGLPGMGNHDLYLTRLQPDGTWATPENLGYPINSKASEGALTVSLDGHKAYFAANRPDSHGGNDIYMFELPENLRPGPVTYLKAKVTDAASGYPVQAKIELDDLAGSTQVFSGNTKSNGEFLVCLPAGKDYALHIDHKGYAFHSENFNLTETASFENPFLLEIALIPLPDSITGQLKSNAPIVLNNVFFETGAAELRKESAAELDRLAALLQAYPLIKIRINGHTDNVGDAKSNQLLSEKRAQAVAQYLQGKGIDKNRLQAVGYGEGRPIAPNTSTEGRAKNRRTEFEMIQ